MKLYYFYYFVMSEEQVLIEDKSLDKENMPERPHLGGSRMYEFLSFLSRVKVNQIPNNIEQIDDYLIKLLKPNFRGNKDTAVGLAVEKLMCHYHGNMDEEDNRWSTLEAGDQSMYQVNVEVGKYELKEETRRRIFEDALVYGGFDMKGTIDVYHPCGYVFELKTKTRTRYDDFNVMYCAKHRLQAIFYALAKECDSAVLRYYALKKNDLDECYDVVHLNDFDWNYTSQLKCAGSNARQECRPLHTIQVFDDIIQRYVDLSLEEDEGTDVFRQLQDDARSIIKHCHMKDLQTKDRKTHASIYYPEATINWTKYTMPVFTINETRTLIQTLADLRPY